MERSDRGAKARQITAANIRKFRPTNLEASARYGRKGCSKAYPVFIYRFFHYTTGAVVTIKTPRQNLTF
jgi:hypothetical protein